MSKNAIFEILANFGTMFADEGLEVLKKPEDMLKRIVLASEKPKTDFKNLPGNSLGLILIKANFSLFLLIFCPFSV